jgi:WXG100 family type VII secretion target
MRSVAADAKIVDESTTVAMILAFDNCQDECVKIQSLVDGARSQLKGTWSGVAAAKYDTSMAEWEAGFKVVRQALDMLNESMRTYANVTGSAEDNNAMLGSGWANVTTA